MPLLLWLLLAASSALAGVTRFAVVAANNEGSAGTGLLVFAETDARKMVTALTGPGQVQPDRVQLLLNGHRNDLLGALVGVRGDVALARERGDDTVVIFYYSGHADDERLQLGRSWVTWDELRDLLTRTGADVRVAFIDACQSGSMTAANTRRKGGVRAPGFVIDAKLGASGQVVFTSSTGDESSHESDAIGGSYFTHHLVSALSGPGDEDRNGQVTLSEAYRYAYRETVFDTSRSATGVQHPTYDWELSGEGDLVLSNLDAASATLVFPAGLSGRFAVYDKRNGQFVSGVNGGAQSQRLALRPGTYLVQERYPTHLREAQINLREGATLAIDAAAFQAVEYEDDVAKGVIDKEIKRSRMPELSLRIASGTRSFSEPTIAAGWFPTTLSAGAIARWNWRDGKWVAADVLGGSTRASLAIEGLGYTVPVRVASTTFGVSAGFATRPRLVQAGAGLRVAGAWFQRSFDDPGVPAQSLLTASPGVVLWGGVHPGRFEFDVEIRSHFLPYGFDENGRGERFGEGLLAVGYRF